MNFKQSRNENGYFKKRYLKMVFKGVESVVRSIFAGFSGSEEVTT